MSTNLATVNLSGMLIGQTGNIDLTQAFGGQSVPDAPGYTEAIYTVRILNESSSGLGILIVPSQQAFSIPAGGWVDCHPKIGDTSIGFTILYMLPNPQVTLLISTLYRPGEEVPPMPILGNSSVGISGGNVSTVGTSLINTGNAASPASVIEVANTTSGGDVTTLDNQGNLVNGNANFPGSFTENGPSRFIEQVGFFANSNAAIQALLEPSGDAIKGLVIFAHSATQSADLLAVQNSLFANLFRVDKSGNLILNGVNLTMSNPGIVTINNLLTVVPQAQQVLTNNSTINYTGTVIHVTCAASVTGIIMQAGTVDGQVCILIYDSTVNSITFAFSGSNVGSGNNNQITGGRLKILVWNATLGLWSIQAGN